MSYGVINIQRVYASLFHWRLKTWSSHTHPVSLLSVTANGHQHLIWFLFKCQEDKGLHLSRLSIKHYSPPPPLWIEYLKAPVRLANFALVI